MNDNGDYFPILGICLGFELLTYVVAERFPHRTRCRAQTLPLQLEFTPGSSFKCHLFNQFPKTKI